MSRENVSNVSILISREMSIAVTVLTALWEHSPLASTPTKAAVAGLPSFTQSLVQGNSSSRKQTDNDDNSGHTHLIS